MSGFAADLEALSQRLKSVGAGTGPVDRSVLLHALETAYEELRAANEEVRAQQEQIANLIHGYDALRLDYERMLSMLPVPVLVTDERATIRVANAAAGAFLQMRPGRMVGKPAMAFVAPDDHRELRRALASPNLRRETLRRTVRMLPRGDDGVTVELALASTPGRLGAVSWMLLSAGATEQRPALRSLPEAVTRLSTLPATTPDVHAALEASAHLVAEALGEGVHVSIATGGPLGPKAVGSSSELAQQVDGAQVMVGEGPCVTAYETATLVETDELISDDRWPRLASRVPAGIGAVAVPLTYGRRPAGVLGVYCVPSCVDEGFAEPCALFAATVTAVIYELDTKAELASVAQGLERAMASRAVIEQAKGIVMAGKGCDADQAFAHLVEISSTHHVKLRDVAQQIVERTWGK